MPNKEYKITKEQTLGVVSPDGLIEQASSARPKKKRTPRPENKDIYVRALIREGKPSSCGSLAIKVYGKATDKAEGSIRASILRLRKTGDDIKSIPLAKKSKKQGCPEFGYYRGKTIVLPVIEKKVPSTTIIFSAKPANSPKK